MRGFVDLHAHWVPGIDDGVRSLDEGLELLAGLGRAGFSRCVATPHMRPGMFDNDAVRIREAYAEVERAREGRDDLPEIGLSSEHWFDDVVFQRLLRGEGVLYPGGKAALVELTPDQLPVRLTDSFYELRRRGIRPVLAHPERYAPVWDDASVLDPLLDGGTLLQLDVCALTGKYGRRAEKTAHALVEEGAYTVAASDAHRPRDAEETARAIERLEKLAGKDEAAFLLRDGPLELLSGTVKA